MGFQRMKQREENMSEAAAEIYVKVGMKQQRRAMTA